VKSFELLEFSVARFRFKAFAANGATESGEIDAGSIEDALDRLASRGLTPFEAVPLGAASSNRPTLSLWSPRKTPLSFYGSFTRQMASLLEAEIPIDHALKFLANNSGKGRMGPLAGKLHDRVANGVSLSAAIEAEAPDAPAYLANIVKAGEARGSLAVTFSELATFIEARVALADKLKASLTYPLILAAAAMVALGIIVTVLVPALLPLFEDAGAAPPFALTMLAWIATAISAHWLQLLALMFAVVTASKVALRSQRLRHALDGLRLKLPMLGEIHRKSSVALFAHTLGTLVRSGMALVPALEISSSVLTNRVLAASVRTAATRVQEGRRLSLALRETGAFPDLAVQLIALGEESGKLDQTLLRLARMFDDENGKSVETGMTLLGPLLTVVIGLGVGGLIVSVMRAMLSVNELVIK
jgi:general secretion pathway protein F